VKILIVRFSSIGDIVLTTPIIRCIKQQVKDVQLHYLTKKSFAEILPNNPYLDKVYSIEKNLSEISEELKKEKYNFVLDLHHNFRTAQLKTLLQKKSGSVNKLNLKKWLMVNLKLNVLPNQHIVDRYFEAALYLEIKNDSQGLDYFIPNTDNVELQSLPPEFSNGYIGFVIGAKHATKQLPPEKIISICKKLNQPIILLGGKEDTAKGDLICKAVEIYIFNACGKYNLNQSASLIKQARKIITHDTGLMHIAAAFKKEIISVWGNTIPAFGMYPYQTGFGKNGQGVIIEVKNLSCRPCSKIGYKTCPKGHFKCMNEINEDLIIKAVNS